MTALLRRRHTPPQQRPQSQCDAVVDEQHDQHTADQPDGKAENVDERNHLVLHQASPGHFEIISEHNVTLSVDIEPDQAGTGNLLNYPYPGKLNGSQIPAKSIQNTGGGKR